MPSTSTSTSDLSPPQYSRHLILSNDYAWNTTFCTPTGQVLFQTINPHTWKDKTTIRKVLLPDLDDKYEGLRDEYEDIAVIDCRNFDKDRIVFRGEEWRVDQFFRKDGWGFYGRNRVFVGPDGLEYSWKMNSETCKLTRQDSSRKTEVVAKSHPRQYGIFSDQKRPPSLEVFECGEHMLELIIVTFVYIEKLRREREEALVAM